MNIHWNVAQRADDTLKNYLEICEQASKNDAAFKTFKSNPSYTPILEHAWPELGANHLQNVEVNNPHLLTDFPAMWDNDQYGTPAKHDYGFRVCSPTTLQYISVLSNLINQVGSLEGFEIVEIGGGYGGQAKIITDAYQVKQYDLVDLYEPSLLQTRYIKEANIPNTRAYDARTYSSRNSYDLVISNYALTEVTDPQQSWYVENILMKAKHGYVTCNGDINRIDLLISKHGDNLKRLPDIRGERESNYIIIW